MKRLFFATAIVLIPVGAMADEQTNTLAQNGDWTAISHQPSEVAPPDVCTALENDGSFGIRSDGTTVEIRSENDAWSLPSGVTGSLSFTVNKDFYSFSIDSNTATMLDATVDANKVQPVLDDMAKAAVLVLTIGHDKPISVSLSGSNSVLNAFRTCAGIGGSAAGGGANPFN